MLNGLSRRVREPSVAALGLRELAWLLEALLVAGIRVRKIGWCLGELEPSDLEYSVAGLSLRPAASKREYVTRSRRVVQHVRRGHDLGCYSLGVPIAVVRRILMASAARGDAAELMCDVADEVVSRVMTERSRDRSRHAGVDTHVKQLGALPAELEELVHGVIASRVTPSAPECARNT